MSDRRLTAIGAIEKRAFGRRSTVRHAWISAGSKSRLSCCIRNLSAGGALLELDVPAWLPWNFELVIEEPRMTIACEVRHRGQYGVGVAFLDNVKGILLLDADARAEQVACPQNITFPDFVSMRGGRLPA